MSKDYLMDLETAIRELIQRVEELEKRMIDNQEIKTELIKIRVLMDENMPKAKQLMTNLIKSKTYGI